MKETPHNQTPTTALPLTELRLNPDVPGPVETVSIDVDEDRLAVDGFVEEVKRVEAEQAAATRHEALALGGIDVDEVAGDRKLVAELIEARGYVRPAPKMKEQLTDDSRTKPFKFLRKISFDEAVEGESTEIDGLRELHSFLTGFIDTSGDIDSVPGSHRKLMNQASGMLENMTFIGDKEYSEAAEGLGMYWKQFLDEDPDRVLCVLAEVGQLEDYRETGERKSDHFLRDQILQTFTDEELERYSGRVVGRVGDLPTDPNNVKIVILDDWTISGMQMRSVYGAFADHPSFRRFINADSLEINLLVASEGHIQDRLVIDPYQDNSPSVRVRSYFMSHHADDAEKEHKSHVSGVYSSVNHDFKVPIQRMSTKLKKLGTPSMTPSLIWVAGAYEDPQRIIISSDRLVRVGDDKEDEHES